MLPAPVIPPRPAASLLAWRRALRPRTRLRELAGRLRKARYGFRPLHNLLIDLRYGGWCGGRTVNPFAASGAFPIQSIDYAALDALHRRNRIAFDPGDVLVDVGCGRGRVLNWWLSLGLQNRLIGLELVPSVAEATAHRLRHHPTVEIRTGDATALLPAEGTFFFLYSPFDRGVMTRFRDALLTRGRDHSRLRVLYFNCRFLDLFLGDARWRCVPLQTGEPEPAALILPR